MATKLHLHFLLILTTFSAVSLQAAHARVLHYKLKVQCYYCNTLTTLHFHSRQNPATDRQAVAKRAGSLATQERVRAYGSWIRAVEFYDSDESGGFTAPPPLSQKESALKAIFVMVILVFLTSCAAALIRIMCGKQGEDSQRQTSEANEARPRPVAEEAQQHYELTFCKCDNFALLTWPF